MSQIGHTRPSRRPELKLIKHAEASTPERITGHIAHDERGNAIWMGEPATLEDLSLTLAADPSTAPVIEHDPYNRPAGAGALKARSR